jgi:hypothetical protein
MINSARISRVSPSFYALSSEKISVNATANGRIAPRWIGDASSSMNAGEVAEWLNVPDSKSGIRASVSRVRIPPSPPLHPFAIFPFQIISLRFLLSYSYPHQFITIFRIELVRMGFLAVCKHTHALDLVSYQERIHQPN